MGRSLRATRVTSCLLVLFLSLILCSCGGTGGGGSTSASSGATPETSSVVVSLPRAAKRTTADVIPSTTAFFEVHILTSDGVTDLVTPVTVTAGTTEVTISNVPVGPAVFEILALDANRGVVAKGRARTIVRRGSNPQVIVDLTAVSPTPTPTPTPTPAAANTYIVVANTTTQSYTSFPRDPVTGAPIAPGNDFPPINAFAPTGMAATPNGKFLFVCGNGATGPVVHPFAVNPTTGILQPYASPLTVTPTYLPGRFPSITVNAAGTLLHVVYNTDLYTYTISAAGALAPYAGSPARIGVANALTGRSVACSPRNETVYVATTGMTTNPLAILQDQGVTGFATAQDANTTAMPWEVAAHPTLNVLYTFDANNKMLTNPLDATGLVANGIGTQTTLDSACAYGHMAMAPNGTALYVTGATTTGLIFPCYLDAAGGAVTPGAGIAAGTDPGGLAVDTTSTYLYVTDKTGDAILTYRLDAFGQPSLTSTIPVPAGTNPGYVVTVTPP